MDILIESQYLPSVAYFTLLAHSDQVWIETQERFEKQTFRNRCEILGANNIQRLSVPLHSANSGLPILKMKIDHRQKWLNNHWRSIQSAYGKAPFFDYYADYLKQELFKPCESIFELNQRLLTLCLKLLGLPVKVKLTKKHKPTAGTNVLDFRSVVHPKKEIEQLTWFRPESYYQVFGKDFVPNLSILDLLFCMGPDSIVVLKKSGVF